MHKEAFLVFVSIFFLLNGAQIPGKKKLKIKKKKKKGILCLLVNQTVSQFVSY